MAVSTSNSNSYLAQVDPYVPTATYDASMGPQSETTPAAAPVEQPGKDEVGWLFVEQYYTTLNKTPEKLHLFYNKKSILTWGTEGDVVTSVAGRSDICERIKQEGFTDCKVRVTNVDSQASLLNSIIIQVIGEMSNDGNLNRKFVQTFFLAEQPMGYYVHNDVFRFLNDEEEELVEEGEEAPEETVEEPTTTEAEPEPVHELAQEPEEAVEEQKAEETPFEEPKAEEPESSTNGITNGTPAEEETKAEAEPEAAPAEEEAKVEETPVAEEPKAEEPVEEKKEEEPKVEEPKAEEKKEETPAPAPIEEKKPTTPAPALPAAPPKPKTWANLVAGGANKAAAAVVNAAAAVAPSAVAPAKESTPTEKPAPATPAAASPAPATPSTPASSGGWQSVGDSTRRHQSKASAAGGDVTLAFVRNVHEKVDIELLEKKLAKFGPLKQFEVSKQRNCAFVEFETAAAFKAAQAANPHQIGSETINVEERRSRQGQSYGGRGGYEGGRGGYTPRGGRGEGRGGFQPRGDSGKFYEGSRPGRGGAQGGRGGFAPRGRGGQSQA